MKNGNVKMTGCMKVCKNDFSISIEPMGRYSRNHAPCPSFLAGQKKQIQRNIIFKGFLW